MAKIKEADKRLFRNVFVCMKCKSKIKASPMKVSEGRVSCRKCGSKQLKPIRKK